MKIIFLLFNFLLAFSLCPTYNFASAEYQEVATSLGKVITGPSKEEALEKFGYPVSATEELWYYVNPKELFVYFPPTNILSIHLYPESCEIPVGFPLEFKAFAYLADSKIKDITSSVELSINEPQDFILEKPGVIIPRNTGEYQILAKYKDIFSNPIYLTVKAQKKEEITEEQLLSINVLPYKPKISLGSRIDFIALGTFFDPRKDIYIIRDISEGAKWFTQKDGSIINEKDRQIYFHSLGKLKVFCKFEDLESDRQEVEVKDIYFTVSKKLKYITLLPEFIIIPSGNTINFVAFASNDDGIEDVTSMVNWRIKDREILDMQERGRFLSKSRGVTEATAELDNLKSTTAKVIVLDAKGSTKASLTTAAVDLQKSKEEKKEMNDYRDLARNIKNDMGKIKNSFAGEGKKITLIKIIPDYSRIPLGEKKQLSALGIYSDNSEIDLTLLGEWISSDNSIATVSLGAVSTLSTGEIKTYVKFQGTESISASVIVEEPKLVSITLSPGNSQLPMEDKLSLKAEGHFSDSSVKDVTALVTWEVTNPRTIKIDKGAVRPSWIGKTQVYCEYSGIKSLPINIKVIFTIQWLLKRIFIIISFLILSIIIVLSILYFVTKNEKDKLLFLYKNPREFIINLYNNTKEILNIFGIKFQEIMVPLSYAKLIEQRYSIKNNLFLRLTIKFEEAKYSSHILESEDANLVLNDYNNLLKEIFGNYNRLSLFFRYCLSLVHRKPLLIYKSSPLANRK